jgi:hypothetical protein
VKVKAARKVSALPGIGDVTTFNKFIAVKSSQHKDIIIRRYMCLHALTLILSDMSGVAAFLALLLRNG